MNQETGGVELQSLRRTIRKRALANLILVLLEEARRTAGRFAVHPFRHDAVLLEYRDVRTLIRRRGIFHFESRDFAVALTSPALWPLDRAAALQPFIMAPNDYCHPNSDGHGLCVDTQGVLPERIPALLYDNLRVRVFRLDHPVDAQVAAFVRAHLADFPADPRPLYAGDGRASPKQPPSTGLRAGFETPPKEGGSLRRDSGQASGRAEKSAAFDSNTVRAEEAPPEQPLSCGVSKDSQGPSRSPVRELIEARPDLPVEDLAVGVFDVGVGALALPVFLRLASVATDIVNRARATYLLVANARLRAGKGGWVEGPGLAVDPADADRDLLRAELYEIGHALAVLGDERIARSYLELCGVKSMTQPGVAAPATRDATTKGGL